MEELYTTEIMLQQLEPFIMVLLAGFSFATICILLTFGISKALALFNII